MPTVTIPEEENVKKRAVHFDFR